MLDLDELRILTAWCAARAMRWRPVSGASVLLEPVEVRGCWQRMMLGIDDDSFELTTEDGEKLASASELHAVLDALEGGVAEDEMPPLPIRQWVLRPGANAPVGYVI